MLYEGDGWHLADGLVGLVEQFDERFRRRDNLSDGSIGDPAHAAVESDHNPCTTCKGGRKGVVRAVDIDAGLDRKDPKAMDRASNQLRRYAKTKFKNAGISYIIFDERIASPVDDWDWRPYFGSNPHITHMHVSSNPFADLNAIVYRLPIFGFGGRVASRLRHAQHQIDFSYRLEYREELRMLDEKRRDALMLPNVLAEHK